MGVLGVSMTDAPACDFDAVNVTVNTVRVHQSSTASDTDSGWNDLTLSPARKINLLNLTDGVLESLDQTSLSAGHYTQPRLVLDANTGNGLANSIVATGSTTEVSLTTPSATQSHRAGLCRGQAIVCRRPDGRHQVRTIVSPGERFLRAFFISARIVELNK